MKKTLHTIAYLHVCIFALLLSACDSYLDETPKGKVIPETVDDFGMMLDDATFFSNNQMAYGLTAPLTMTDDVNINPRQEGGFYNVVELKAYEWADELYPASEDDKDWTTLYHNIYICNYIAENIDAAPAGDGKYGRAVVKAQARFHRAYAYLMLANLYGPHYDKATAGEDLAVPLLTTPSLEAKLPRATVAEVYDFVLSEAKALEQEGALPEDAEYTFRPSRTALDCLLMRTYLYMGEYGLCQQYAERARQQMGEPQDYNGLALMHPLIPDPGFWDGWDTDLNHNADQIYYKCAKNGHTTQNMTLSQDLLALFDKDADLRFRLFVTDKEWYSPTPSEFGFRVSMAYDVTSGFTRGEVLVTEAEAAARQGDAALCLSCLNALRVKRMDAALYQPLAESDAAKALTLALDERRRELMFHEGLRWFDMRRLDREGRMRTVTHTSSNGTFTLEPHSPKYTLPIPLKVMGLNPLMVGNKR